MAVGLAAGVANAIMNAYARGTDYVGNTAFWVKLHLGDPGAAGAANPAAETTRIQGTFGSVASAGAISNTVALEWTTVSTQEVYSHVSFWDDETAGTFQGSDALNASKAVDSGDDFTISVGELDLSIAPLAA